MIEILPFFASSPKTAFGTAAVSFVRLRSSVHSVLPFKDTSVHRILLSGGCLDRLIEGETGASLNKGKNMCHLG